MRITQGSVFTRMGYTVQELQSKIDVAHAKISTGREIQQLSDNPTAVGEIQNLNEILSRNSSYAKNIEESTSELQTVSEIIENSANIVQEVRMQANEAMKPSNLDKLPVFAVQVRNLLTDLINQANSELHGHLLFAGTKTTAASIVPVPPETNTLPFELVQDTPSANNPSGLRVAFKGNLQDRSINRSSTATETINVTADKLFGGSGTETFDHIIDLYNKLAYDESGTLRQPGQPATAADTQRIQGTLANIGNAFDNMNTTNSVVGVKINRLQMISEQMSMENMRLSALRSNLEDTDMAKAALDMQRGQASLQYSLQIGAKLIQQSLFDFLR